MGKQLRPRPRPERADGAAVKGVGSGLLGGFLACLPCFPPAMALLLGLGGSTVFVGLTRYEPLFQLAGFVLTLAVAWWFLRHRVQAYRRDRTQLPVLLLAVGTYVIAYLVIAYVVTPLLYQVYARR